MGEVYRARDPRMGREVAIKVSAARFNDRFEREVHAVAALNHPNICHLYDVGPNYLVMELVEGPTLAERIASGAIPLDESLAIARQIADALEAAHEKGIVHRDLKPRRSAQKERRIGDLPWSHRLSFPRQLSIPWPRKNRQCLPRAARARSESGPVRLAPSRTGRSATGTAPERRGWSRWL
jgi:hypothetical protein